MQGFRYASHERLTLARELAYPLTMQCHDNTFAGLIASLHNVTQCQASYHRVRMQALQGGCTVEEALMKFLLNEEEDGDDIAYASQQPDMLDSAQAPFDIPMGASQSNPVDAPVRFSHSNGHVPVQAAANGSSSHMPPRQPVSKQPVGASRPAGDRQKQPVSASRPAGDRQKQPVSAGGTASGRQKQHGQNLQSTSCLPSLGNSLQHANSLGSQHSGLDVESQV